ncbi:MAG: hypothetical protein IPH08_04060 [Rhodocyclaceae bacterium]|nr:hypothetical protein [Rhodocyclaceae bacterium]MBK6906307.1 hypothetical protein [Rhodocyclaceae bacterium]
MFAEARRDGLWFRCTYQDLWFSPDDLEAAQANGRFIWSAMNWELRPPADYIAKMERMAKDAADRLEEAKERVG